MNVLEVTRDGKRAVFGGVAGGLKVWDLDSGEQLRAVDADSGGTVDVLELTRDGKRAVTGDRDGSLKVWDLDSGEQPQRKNWTQLSPSASTSGQRGKPCAPALECGSAPRTAQASYSAPYVADIVTFSHLRHPKRSPSAVQLLMRSIFLRENLSTATRISTALMAGVSLQCPSRNIEPGIG